MEGGGWRVEGGGWRVKGGGCTVSDFLRWDTSLLSSFSRIARACPVRIPTGSDFPEPYPDRLGRLKRCWVSGLKCFRVQGGDVPGSGSGLPGADSRGQLASVRDLTGSGL